MKLNEQIKGELHYCQICTSKLFKLSLTPNQEKVLAHRRVLNQFRRVTPEVAGNFIAKAQSVFSEIDYAITNLDYDYPINTEDGFVNMGYLGLLIVAPLTVINQIKYLRENGELKDFYDTYDLLYHIPHLTILGKYEMYNQKSGVSSKLVDLDDRFINLVNQLVYTRLEDPSIPMVDAMDMVVKRLKEGQYRRIIG